MKPFQQVSGPVAVLDRAEDLLDVVFRVPRLLAFDVEDMHGSTPKAKTILSIVVPAKAGIHTPCPGELECTMFRIRTETGYGSPLSRG